MKTNTQTRPGQGLRVLTISLTTVAVMAMAAPATAQNNPQYGNPQQGNPQQTGQSGRESLTAEKFVRQAAAAGAKEVKLAELALQKSDNSRIQQFAEQVKQDHMQANQQFKQICRDQKIDVHGSHGAMKSPGTHHGQTGAQEAYRDQARAPGAYRDRTRESDASTSAQRQMRPPADAEVRDRTQRDQKLAGTGQRYGSRDEQTSRSHQAGTMRPPASADVRDRREDGRSQDRAARTDVADLPAEDRQAIERLQAMSGEEFNQAFVEQMIKDHEKSIDRFERAARTLEDPQLRQFARQTLPVLQQHYRQAQELARSVGLPSDTTASR